LLYRLGISEYREQFLLKGAMLFALWYDMPHRPAFPCLRTDRLPVAQGQMEQQLLANRYASLQLDPEHPWRAPVEDAVVEWLYQLFRGDLRGMLKALEDGMTALLGLTAAATSAGVAPVGMEDLLLVLQDRNQQELEDQLGPTAWERLSAWGNRDPEALEIQTGLKTLWGISQPAVSQTLQQLTTAAAVEALPRKGRDPIQYMLTGTARLAF